MTSPAPNQPAGERAHPKQREGRQRGPKKRQRDLGGPLHSAPRQLHHRPDHRAVAPDEKINPGAQADQNHYRQGYAPIHEQPQVVQFSRELLNSSIGHGRPQGDQDRPRSRAGHDTASGIGARQFVCVLGALSWGQLSTARRSRRRDSTERTFAARTSVRKRIANSLGGGRSTPSPNGRTIPRRFGLMQRASACASHSIGSRKIHSGKFPARASAPFSSGCVGSIDRCAA